MGSDLLIDHFEKTGLIRPDSLTLFMTNFKSYPIQTKNSVELSVWSSDHTDSIDIITDVVPKTLDFMTSYLATNFPTKKLDIVVVPSMVMPSTESPGLIVIKFVKLKWIIMHIWTQTSQLTAFAVNLYLFFFLFFLSRDSVLGTAEKLSIVDYQKSVEFIVLPVIRQWLLPQRGLDRGSNEDKWINEALVNFLKIINIDHVRPTIGYIVVVQNNKLLFIMLYRKQ
jgi:hypothetical protein